MTLLVKICGLSTPQALDVALESGADMVGFVIVARSPAPHRRFVERRAWHRLNDVPVLDDLAVLQLEDVDDGVAAGAGLPDRVDVEDDVVAVGEHALDLAARAGELLLQELEKRLEPLGVRRERRKQPGELRQERERGYELEVYPGPEAPPKKLIVEKAATGVDGLITDRPDVAQRVLAARGVVPR